MKFLHAMTVLGLLAVSGCGSLATNTNASGMINLGGSAAVDGSGVQVVERAPATAIELSGIDCRNKIWNPAPTREGAIQVLMAQVKDAGYSNVQVTSVTDVAAPVAINCWSAIEAKGLAF